MYRIALDYDTPKNVHRCESGLEIRNLKLIERPGKKVDRITFTFQAKVTLQGATEPIWVNCGSPCGDWSQVMEWWKDNSFPFSVSVGWWELQDIFNNHPEVCAK